MTVKEKLAIHDQIVKDNERKLNLWKRFNYAEKVLGFRPQSVEMLIMYECTGYDDSILMFA